MSTSVATFTGPSINIDCSADGRPVKRPRKDHQPATHSEGMHQEFTVEPSSSQNHVFISETLTSKKQGGKKVAWPDLSRQFLGRFTILSFRFHCHVVNAGGESGAP